MSKKEKNYYDCRQNWCATLGVGDGQGSLACFCPSGCKESDKTEQLN